jgi:hypothetical protein
MGLSEGAFNPLSRYRAGRDTPHAASQIEDGEHSY